VAGMPKSLKAELGAIDGVVVSESMIRNGDAYWCNGKEIAHLEHGGAEAVLAAGPGGPTRA
jgi:hypothetical protein